MAWKDPLTVSKVEPSGAIKTRFNTHQCQACQTEIIANFRTEVSDVHVLKQRKQRAQTWKRSSNVTTQMWWLHTDFTQSVVPQCRWVDGLARAQGRAKTKVRPRPLCDSEQAQRQRTNQGYRWRARWASRTDIHCAPCGHVARVVFTAEAPPGPCET